jgi:hypothetical protein
MEIIIEFFLKNNKGANNLYNYNKMKKSTGLFLKAARPGIFLSDSSS